MHLQLYIYCLPTSKIWLTKKLSLCTFIPNNISLAERWLITTPRLLHHLITSAQKLWVIRQETKDLIKDFYLCFKHNVKDGFNTGLIWFEQVASKLWAACFSDEQYRWNHLKLNIYIDILMTLHGVFKYILIKLYYKRNKVEKNLTSTQFLSHWITSTTYITFCSAIQITMRFATILSTVSLASGLKHFFVV